MTTRREAVGALAALPFADAAGAVPVAASAELDWPAIVARLELIIDALGTRHVRDGFKFDPVLAREALAHCRRVAAGDSEDDPAPLLAFASRYGLRLEWILTGNLRGTWASSLR